MARYDYRCAACGATFEVEHRMSEHPEVSCPSCGAPAERVFSPSGIRFVGSGFYNTDQRGGGSSTKATSAPEAGSHADAAHSSSCENCPHKAQSA